MKETGSPVKLAGSILTLSLIWRSLIKHIFSSEDELSIHSPVGCGNSVPGLSIHPLHHMRVVADEVNSVVVTGSGVVGGEEHSLGST